MTDWAREWEIYKAQGELEYKEKLGNVQNCYFSPRQHTELESSYMIEYRKGSFAAPHVDSSLKTEVTLLYKSRDLEGGDMIVEGKHIDMEVGETYTYLPEQKHEVTKVKKGVRRVLISWFHKNNS